MKNLKLLTLFAFIGLFLTACHCDDDNPTTCDQQTIIDEEQFENAPNDQLFVNDLEIVDDCLTINFSSSGCDGNSWEIKLVTTGAVAYSQPPQRFLLLSLKNTELCDAVITREVSFDIENLQVLGNEVILNIINGNDSILYTY